MRIRLAIIAIGALVTSTASYAQDAKLETIPHTLARVGQSLTDRPSIPSGVVQIAEILRRTELIVRGHIGSPTAAYLSKSERDIYTDYALINPIVLYDSRRQSPRAPGPDITVTVLGGSVQIGKLSFTLIPEALRYLPVGAEGLFLLQRIDDKYQPAGRFFGAFEISGDRFIQPFTRASRLFEKDYRGASVSATAKTWVAAVAERHQSRK